MRIIAALFVTGLVVFYGYYLVYPVIMTFSSATVSAIIGGLAPFILGAAALLIASLLGRIGRKKRED